jgi:hypothetical protein
MNSKTREESNLQFLKESIANAPLSEFKKWFWEQEDYVKEDVVSLIDIHIMELQDLKQDLTGDVATAQNLLKKITAKI